MKLKGSYKYDARLTQEELATIKKGLEVLLECYQGGHITIDEANGYKEGREEEDVQKIYDLIDEKDESYC